MKTKAEAQALRKRVARSERMITVEVRQPQDSIFSVSGFDIVTRKETWWDSEEA